ncbi:putative oxidoreductase, 2OG-Fe(II) oxygenase family [Aspergillus brunneoviolaceus CBS 621.78]|uniref:Oxidoreductase n=1 Tax=Aspergillus brunneoviolaceus CBS 621.78 TaxID=1450534 RepID=A0ACD1GL42_9EURO|nr:oxidoreductase [Aspergillus brunneoviolaceus CBS 621.78]RAH50004.1 oxidoreductase [Aspergillus brunneoviolaceus CBS 621.78]
MGPVAQLQTINLQALKRGCADEVSKLLGAAEQNGIFYLDLTDEVPLDGVPDEIDRLSRSLFGLSAEEKMRFDVDKLDPYKLNGYKPVGRNAGGIPGQRDGFESYAISSNPDSPAPPVVAQFRPELAEFQSICLDLAQVLFESLSVACGLPKESSFQACHSNPALNLVRLLRYPGALAPDNPHFSIPQPAHTDMGSLTFLCTDAPGLQIQPVGSSDWLHVLPKRGHPVVNLGDAMKTLSNGRFQSVLHRVISVPGGGILGAEDRYSFAYLLRPEPSTPMAPLPGLGSVGSEGEPVRTCEEWVSMKFRALRA